MKSSGAASAVMVKADLHEVCRKMVRDLGGDRATSERAARGLKKVAEARGEAGSAALWGARKELFRQAVRAEDMRVRWNLVIVLGKLHWRRREKAAVVDWLFERLGDQSVLTRTFAMQALWDLSAGDPALRGRVMEVASRFAESGSPAMQARARRLLSDRKDQ